MPICTDRNGEFLGFRVILVSGLDCSDILKSLESWALSTIFGQGPVTSFKTRLGIKESVVSSLVESLDVFESLKILVSSKERFLTVKSFDEFDGFELLESISVLSLGKPKLSDTGTHGPSFSKAILYSIPSSSSDSDSITLKVYRFFVHFCFLVSFKAKSSIDFMMAKKCQMTRI